MLRVLFCVLGSGSVVLVAAAHWQTQRSPCRPRHSSSVYLRDPWLRGDQLGDAVCGGPLCIAFLCRDVPMFGAIYRPVLMCLTCSRTCPMFVQGGGLLAWLQAILLRILLPLGAA